MKGKENVSIGQQLDQRAENNPTQGENPAPGVELQLVDKQKRVRVHFKLS